MRLASYSWSPPANFTLETPCAASQALLVLEGRVLTPATRLTLCYVCTGVAVGAPANKSEAPQLATAVHADGELLQLGHHAEIQQQHQHSAKQGHANPKQQQDAQAAPPAPLDTPANLVLHHQ
jgi:hypothetical protein